MKLLLSAGFIILASLVTLSAISTHLFLYQLAWMGIGALIIAILKFRDWSGILRARWFTWSIYALSIAFLVVTYIKAPVIRNTRSWIVLGPVQFQPVELAKIALILVLAGYFSRRHAEIGQWRHLLFSFVIFAIPAGLTLLQPDLGSASILFAIWFGYLLVSGLPRRWLIASVVIIAIGGLVGWHWFLKPYQKERITGVFYPERNALGINYSTIQSKIAIGSGGFWGKGWKQGTQTELGYLTEPGTDFIFAAFAEEWGAVGAFALLVAFLIMLFEVLKIGAAQNSNFEHLVALGVAITFSIQFLVNAGSATGLFPVVGVTFPFLSYGGSSLLANFTLLGLVNAMRRRG
jgi:rod shape determining protein RodA